MTYCPSKLITLKLNLQNDVLARLFTPSIANISIRFLALRSKTEYSEMQASHYSAKEIQQTTLQTRMRPSKLR